MDQINKYSLAFSPILKKYGVKDNNDNIILDYKYDSITIIDDKYAIVGSETTSINYDTTIQEYLYGLIDLVSCHHIFPEKYEFLYISNNRIYILPSEQECGKIRGINEVTFLKQYVWHFHNGSRYFDFPIVAGSKDLALLAIRNEEDLEFTWEFRIVDAFGKCIKSEMVKYDNSLLPYNRAEGVPDYLLDIVTDRPANPIYSKGYLRLDDFGTLVSSKWKLFENKIQIKSGKNRKFDISIELPDGQNIKAESYEIVGNHFLVCKSKPYRSNHVAHTTIVNSVGKIIFSSDSPCIIDQLSRGWYDILILDDMICLDAEGNIFKSPYVAGQHCLTPDNCGFVRYYNKGFFGVADNKGNYISPCIFPVPNVQREISDWSDKDYSSNDAYEGLSDARWNTD